MYLICQNYGEWKQLKCALTREWIKRLVCTRFVVSDSFATPRIVAPPGSSVRGILHARILEWVAMPSSRGSSRPRELNLGLLRCRQILYHLSHLGNPEETGTSVQCNTSEATEMSYWNMQQRGWISNAWWNLEEAKLKKSTDSVIPFTWHYVQVKNRQTQNRLVVG